MCLGVVCTRALEVQATAAAAQGGARRGVTLARRRFATSMFGNRELGDLNRDFWGQATVLR